MWKRWLIAIGLLNLQAGYCFMVADPNVPNGLDFVDESNSLELPLGDVDFPIQNTSYGLTYLGNGWTIRAAHGGGSAFNYRNPNGSTTQYPYEQGSQILFLPNNMPITAADAQAQGLTWQNGGVRDLILVRLQNDPQLPPVEIYDGNPINKEILYYSLNKYTTSYDPVLNEYTTSNNNRWNWGTNDVDAYHNFNVTGTQLLRTDWDDPLVGNSATTYEAQAIGGDSASGVWYKDNGIWKITGVTVAELQTQGSVPNVPGTGHFSLIENLVPLKSAIEDIINNSPPIQSLNGKFRDFDGDGNNDILWRIDDTNHTVVHTYDDSNLLTANFTTHFVGGNWDVAGVGDFDGDEKADILWRNKINGRTVIHFMDGHTLLSSADTTHFVGLNWEVAGVGDFDEGYTADIVWRNKVDGRVVIHYMDGSTFLSAENTSHPVGLNWFISGVGDFDNDGLADIVWRRVSNSAVVVIHYMDGATLVSASPTDFPVGNLWNMAGVSDFDGDGKADILWHRPSTATTVIHHMDGHTFVDAVPTSSQPPTGWTPHLH